MTRNFILSTTLAAVAFAASGMIAARAENGAPERASRALLASKALRIVSVKLRQADLSEPTVAVPASTKTTLADLTAIVKCPAPGNCVLGVDAYLQMSVAPVANGAICVLVDSVEVGGCANAETWNTAHFGNLVDRRFIKISPGSHTINVQAWAGNAGTVSNRSAEFTVYKNK